MKIRMRLKFVSPDKDICASDYLHLYFRYAIFSYVRITSSRFRTWIRRAEKWTFILAENILRNL